MGNSDSLVRVELNKFFYYEIVKLLLNVFKGKLSAGGLTVKTLLSVSQDFKVVRDVSSYISDNKLYDTDDENFLCEIEFEGKPYRLIFRNIDEKYTGHCYSISFIPKDGEKGDKEIKDKLLKLSGRYCETYSPGVFEVEDYDEYYSLNCLILKKAEVQDKKLDDIFISSEIKDDVTRFIYTFKNFEDFEFPMRYLLSGKPGLGKSEIIRAVISSCMDSGTVLIPKNFTGDFGLIFDLAKQYEPALICIDDIDLFLGERENNHDKSALGEFLNAMDGLVKNKVFVIASTNDKTLVDFAASRPGRFDMVIDFGVFDGKFYLPLVESVTKDERIISLFDGEVMESMKRKEVTGAFIVNLVKQLSVVIGSNPAFTSADLEKMIDRSFRGFYGSQLRDRAKLGFVLNGND